MSWSCPYFSRFMRNVKQALIFRDEMHARGAVVYVCDERILSSDERGWDEWVREAHDAEAFSRKLSRRVGEGYDAKRRRLGVPGGNRPPLGYMRVRSDPANPRSPQQLVVDPDKAAVVRRAFESVGLGADGSRGRGRRRAQVDPSPRDPQEPCVHRPPPNRGGVGRSSAGLEGALGRGLGRALAGTPRRHRGPVSQRTYALATLLVCAACGRRLTGHVGRYRHVDACDAVQGREAVSDAREEPGRRSRERARATRSRSTTTSFPRSLTVSAWARGR